MFRGITKLNLDGKGRMAIPARYRERLVEDCGGRLIVTLDRDRCLLIYPFPEWQRIEQELMKLPSLSRPIRALQRFLLGHATDAELDSQGRILLSSELRQEAQLDKRVVLVGQGNKFELWNEEAWAKQMTFWLQDESAAEEFNAALDSLSI